MSKSDRDAIFGEKEGSPYLWCLHCERTYETGKWRLMGELQMCPYQDCDGDAVLDAWDWEQIRSANPQYPEIPEFGKVYPMYPDEGPGDTKR